MMAAAMTTAVEPHVVGAYRPKSGGGALTIVMLVFMAIAVLVFVVQQIRK